METSSNPLLEAILFTVYILLACMVPLLLAYMISSAASKRSAKKKPTANETPKA